MSVRYPRRVLILWPMISLPPSRRSGTAKVPFRVQRPLWPPPSLTRRLVFGQILLQERCPTLALSAYKRRASKATRRSTNRTWTIWHRARLNRIKICPNTLHRWLRWSWPRKAPYNHTRDKALRRLGLALPQQRARPLLCLEARKAQMEYFQASCVYRHLRPPASSDRFRLKSRCWTFWMKIWYLPTQMRLWRPTVWPRAV